VSYFFTFTNNVYIIKYRKKAIANTIRIIKKLVIKKINDEVCLSVKRSKEAPIPRNISKALCDMSPIQGTDSMELSGM
jgi:hypothetical protein